MSLLPTNVSEDSGTRLASRFSLPAGRQAGTHTFASPFADVDHDDGGNHGDYDDEMN